MNAQLNAHFQEKPMPLMMRKSGTSRFPYRFMEGSLFVLLFSLVLASEGYAQEVTPHQGEVVTPLSDLLKEAEQNNPQIRAARQGWEAAKQVPSQVSTLPDPQFNVQPVSVGSPRPFAGYTNSDFAYFGLGVSQDFPYPGKLRLKGEMAKRDADVVQQRYESVRRSILAGVKSAYFQLAYLSKTLGILESDGELLQQVERAADARYRSGIGSQHDVLQAQVERTKLLREITMHHLEVAKLQAQIKQLLNRAQSSPDIESSELPETPLPYTFEELLSATKAQNPEIAGAEKMVEKQKLQVDLAHKDFYPDFNVQYMWQRTDPTQFRAYYMLTFGLRVPIYREELLPQARAGFQGSIAAYQNNRQDFSALLTSFLDVLHLDEEYWKSIAERETALARLEQLTGLALREEGAKR